MMRVDAGRGRPFAMALRCYELPQIGHESDRMSAAVGQGVQHG